MDFRPILILLGISVGFFIFGKFSKKRSWPKYVGIGFLAGSLLLAYFMLNS